MAKLSWPEGLPFSDTFDDIYFSTDNGLAEKTHVFIDGNQLIKRWETLSDNYFTIGETGFGSGLNFLLAWSLWLSHAPKSAKLFYYSCEKFPLRREDLETCLNLWPQLHDLAQELINTYPVLTPGFHQLEFAEGRINLTLMIGEASACYKELLLCGDNPLEGQLRTNFVDAWFLDGFTPSKNKEMWSTELLQILALLSKKGTTLATYSAAALVKENLLAAGFKLNKRKGFGAKRSMVVAQLETILVSNKKLRSTPWQIVKPINYKQKKAIVIGAGLAGCFSAYALAKRGWQVLLLDENSEVGQGASGNTQAVLYPKFSGYRSPFTEFMLSAYLYAIPIYKQLLQSQTIGQLSGLLQLASNEPERLSQVDLNKWLCAYPELARLVDSAEASCLAGIQLDEGGLFINDSGWLDSQALCHNLRQRAGIQWIPNNKVNEINYEDGLWQAGDNSAEVLVLANGYQATHFSQTEFFPLKPIRGQMTTIASNEQSLKLKIPICGEGHILPAHRDRHALGASYHLNSIDSASYLIDDEANLSRLANFGSKINWSAEIKENWVGIRAATTDYLPLVGPIPDVERFYSHFSTLSTNAKRWIPLSGTYLPGLFICAGFGSRGLATIPLAAEWLASLINQEPAQISQSVAKSLAPARFLIKKIIRGYD